jgi:hypothetical protein
LYQHGLQLTAFDKAKVEAAVGIVSRFVLGKLRNLHDAVTALAA